jgi:hypothetical protein
MIFYLPFAFRDAVARIFVNVQYPTRSMQHLERSTASKLTCLTIFIRSKSLNLGFTCGPRPRVPQQASIHETTSCEPTMKDS